MRNYGDEFKSRVGFIEEVLKESGASGIVFGNSGGKDSALVGILCKAACGDTVGVVMPCASSRNFGEDMRDALELAGQFGIETRTVDLTGVRAELLAALQGVTDISDSALMNVAPRLRMTALYTVAMSEGRLVAGTGNRSEVYMGYFTKWGDGAYDFNPISDLTATEVVEFLRHLGAPEGITEKAPSAGLFDGQTDEADMGVTYAAIDRFLLTGEAESADLEIITRYNSRSGHKRRDPPRYSE